MANPFPSSDPIDLDALDDYLMSDHAPDDSMGLSDLDGFLTGIVVGPELILPSEWLPVIWGGEEPEFQTEDEMRTVLGTIMGRYNEIVACLEVAAALVIQEVDGRAVERAALLAQPPALGGNFGKAEVEWDRASVVSFQLMVRQRVQHARQPLQGTLASSSGPGETRDAVAAEMREILRVGAAGLADVGARHGLGRCRAVCGQRAVVVGQLDHQLAGSERCLLASNRWRRVSSGIECS